jgi:hypothetical protein
MLEVFQAKLAKTVPTMAQRAPDVEVDPGLEAAITGGLMTDRRERYESAATFRERLAEVPAS